MTEKGADILRAAQQTGRTSEEARQSQRQINQMVDWDLHRMLPELYDSRRRGLQASDDELSDERFRQ